MLWRLFIISNQVNPPKGQLNHQDKYKCKNEHQDKYNDREKRQRRRDDNQVNFFPSRLSGVSGSISQSTNFFWANLEIESRQLRDDLRNS